MRNTNGKKASNATTNEENTSFGWTGVLTRLSSAINP
jgi:hypothetical protein